MKSHKELLWKSRRGMKELDILFEHYLFEHYPTAHVSHQQAFEKLTAMQDPIIVDYLFERAQPNSSAIADIIGIMRAFTQQPN